MNARLTAAVVFQDLGQGWPTASSCATDAGRAARPSDSDLGRIVKDEDVASFCPSDDLIA